MYATVNQEHLFQTDRIINRAVASVKYTIVLQNLKRGGAVKGCPTQ
jgi:hypothetical protein